MKILVFSDSHGSSDRLRHALSLHGDADLVCFLGDGLREFSALAEELGIASCAVCGNCDLGFFVEEEEELLSFEGHKILLTHGHRYGVKGGLGHLISASRRRGIDIALFGHTHERCEQYLSDGDSPLWLFNPGSISRPRSGRASYGILMLSRKNVLLSHGELS
jgi:putative phosphoesterase